MNIEQITRAYIAAALWASADDDYEPLDARYSDDDIAPDTLATMREDVARFVEANRDTLDEMGLAWGQSKADRDAQIGHDLWLTRNRHGAGFWDRGLGDIGDKLTEAAHAFGDVSLYVGDDGLIYQS